MDNRRLLLTSDEVVMEGAKLYDSSTYNGEAIEWIYVPILIPSGGYVLDIDLTFVDLSGQYATTGTYTRKFYFMTSSTWLYSSQNNTYTGIKIRIGNSYSKIDLGEGGNSLTIYIIPRGGTNSNTNVPKLFNKDVNSGDLIYVRLYIGEDMFKMTINDSYFWNHLSITGVTKANGVMYPFYYKPYSA